MKQIIKKDIYKPIILTIWGVLIVIFLWQVIRLNIPLQNYPRLIADTIQQFGIVAPLLFIFLFAIRPLIFFPATLLSVSAGFLFGPWKAIVILMIAENLSSFVSYSAGKYVGKDMLQKMDSKNIWLHKFETYFHHNEFLTILILRLIYAPFDLLGYFAGASNISYRSFALATIVGIIPGLTTVAFLGRSATHPFYLLISAFFFVIGIFISKVLKFRYSKERL
ncbi:MAG: hypothetical protein COZ34_03635 [Candidatus Pacebacteria bacterium CG_4_10_14_3_um_filter_34_15]|nr:VTT domain-containing protein [Candidatus Pacearchaeota archaeon]NCQ65713.1 VTT domain-containing protein [Candidatus Paceibacterota bacterium]OIO44733.1 MAG: hypothetical protein AUJ41_02025 [Candidatus Pacebacteria bacterium CG1_02_43_31]PIQ81407.1 MAG: hypothetical protein COV78_00390 [Candidatus Pacebacteria bacterium CG11_big_fil_rev_8_21_14_0_20_34_55]PIX81350.1 MAG: hypothetical protein COZ34_03635 [Candidatus Pacebacteria bacterium CG_4_10_14_3_um_filter_34_15]PJC43729.1 MAG: hypoth